MPICIVALTLLGLGVLGLGLGAALLVAAALAPTDPVLASEVQVGEPADDEEESEQGEDEIRFGLTSEAGLNDGLAFPFVYLAIAISLVGPSPSEWFVSWFATDVVWRIGMGVLLGWLTGKALSQLFFSARDSLRLSSHSEGFVALAATFLAYGVTEMLEGYGFIAVFVCAVTIRAAERTHGFHRVMHSYVEQLERLMTVVILVLLGGAIARGLLAGIGWAEILVALAFLLVVRPLAGWIGLARGKTGPRERIAIAFFGIRGIGSLYYLAYALSKGDFDAQAEAAVGVHRPGGGDVHRAARGHHGSRHEPAGPAPRTEGRPAVWRRGQGAENTDLTRAGRRARQAAGYPSSVLIEPRGHLRGAGVDVELRVQLGDIEVQQFSARGHLAAHRADHRQRHAVGCRRAHARRHRGRQHVQVDGQIQGVDLRQERGHKGTCAASAEQSSSSR